MAGRKEFDDAGITVVGGGNITMTSSEEPQLRAMFDYAKDVRLSSMMIIAPSPTNMPKIEKLVKEYNIKVAIHNHGPEDKNYPSPQSVLADHQEHGPARRAMYRYRPYGSRRQGCRRVHRGSRAARSGAAYERPDRFHQSG